LKHHLIEHKLANSLTLIDKRHTNATTSQREQVGNVSNPFLNFVGQWQNYLMEWIEVNRDFYENAIKTNEQWLKALWYPWLRGGNPEQENSPMPDKLAE